MTDTIYETICDLCHNIATRKRHGKEVCDDCFNALEDRAEEHIRCESEKE